MKKEIINQNIFVFLIMALMIPCSFLGGESFKGRDKSATYQLPGSRFYFSTLLDLNRDGTTEIFSVGQKDRKNEKEHDGYVALFTLKKNKLQLLSEDTFSIKYNNQELQGRCRTAAVLFEKSSKKWYLYSVGRGGTDETGVGFLKQWIIENSSLKSTQTLVFHQKNEQYTHGYPLKVADITGNEKKEILYGGFSGEDEVDYADVRIFRIDNSNKLEEMDLKPFAKLPIPFRINALDAVDINGDGKAEIFIAGRTSLDGKKEKAVFAWWCNGKVHHQIIDTPTPSRLRTLLIADLNGDNKKELMTGGRMKLGKSSVGFITIWNINPEKVVYQATYTWTLGGATRLRTFSPTHENGNFFVGGRSEIWKDDSLHWEGFVGKFTFKDGKIQPLKKFIFLNLGNETRIRNLQELNKNQWLASGFILNTEKKSTGFIKIDILK